jgi:uncharacterized membrane protein YoaK (UPF0700 family)
MPLFYLRRLTATQRSETANRHLARYLAFVAGAANAGGFLAVRQHTSHMSGIIAAMADNFARGSLPLVINGLAAVLSFMLGALFTTLCIRWARSRDLESQYALPLLIESALLIIFGFVGHEFSDGSMVGTVMLLCFTMGLQNAMITKISDSVIRTTHLTGMVTDIGIALGRILFNGVQKIDAPITDELATLRLLTSLIGLFFVGGVTGALGFKHVGFFFALPLAGILLVLAAIPVIDDVRRATTVFAEN